MDSAFTALLADRDAHRDESRGRQMALEQFAAQIAALVGLELKDGTTINEVVAAVRAKVNESTPKDAHPVPSDMGAARDKRAAL